MNNVIIMFSLCASFSAFVRSLLKNQTRRGYKVYHLVDDDIEERKAGLELLRSAERPRN